MELAQFAKTSKQRTLLDNETLFLRSYNLPTRLGCTLVPDTTAWRRCRRGGVDIDRRLSRADVFA
eukprot:scaffold284358_cov55-Attheya_sp.AAC.2